MTNLQYRRDESYITYTLENHANVSGTDIIFYFSLSSLDPGLPDKAITVKI
jgi:hypothetical protein